MASTEHIKELLERYRNGTCTPQEAAWLEQWFEQVQHEKDSSSLLTEADEARLMHRLKHHPRFAAPAPVKTRLLLWRAAAVWAGLVLLTATSYVMYKRYTNVSISETLSFLEVRTSTDQRQRIILPDSSVVWLNNNSRLAYHPDFARHREVRLEGEAFFEITHDPLHPFTVQAGKASTKVYGTAFNISAYTNAGELRIGLQKGSIGITYDSSIQSGGQKMLSPGQLFIYNNQTDAAQIVAEAPGDMGGWVSGKLIFNRMQLTEVLAQLERQYGITCSYGDGLKNILITARFEDATLDKVAEHLSFGWDLQFKRSGDTLYIK